MFYNVYATTHVTRCFDYGIWFRINSGGQIRVMQEYGHVYIRAYMLLHMLAKTYKAIGVKMPRRDIATLTVLDGYVRPISVLQYGCRQHTLDAETNGTWISQPDIPKMVGYFIKRPKRDRNKPGFDLIEKPVEWEIFIQKRSGRSLDLPE